MPEQFHIRSVDFGDMQSIAILMRGLGYENSVSEVTRRWTLVNDRKSNPALVALEDKSAIGLIALHIAPMLFYPRPRARITTLVVAPDRRRLGVGRALVEVAEGLAIKAGCDAIELTTANRRVDAHAFYRSMGFENPAHLMERRLEGAQGPTGAGQ